MILLKENLTNQSKEQLEKVLDTVKEDHHAIMFLYKMDKQKYSKLLEEMENDILQKKDPFPKTVSNMYRVLAGWKNRYGNRYSQKMIRWHLLQHLVKGLKMA